MSLLAVIGSVLVFGAGPAQAASRTIVPKPGIYSTVAKSPLWGFHFSISPQHRITSVDPAWEMQCPYHGGVWKWVATNTGLTRTNFPITIQAKSTFFHAVLHATAYLTAAPEATRRFTATITGHFTSTYRVVGTTTFSPGCTYPAEYRTWVAYTGYP